MAGVVFVEVLDIKTGSVTTNLFYGPVYNFGFERLACTCLIPLPEDNSFLFSGGEIYSLTK